MVLLQVPPEILDAIISKLRRRDIKSLRKSCKALNQAASPYLFPSLYLSCHPLDLDVFRLVAANPLLISRVSELIIDDTTLSARLLDQNLFKVASSRGLIVCPGTDLPRRDIRSPTPPDDDPFGLYKSVCDGHHRNREAKADLEALKEVLPRMAGLKRITITNRTADERPESGAQSEFSSSPTVKKWRRFGQKLEHRLHFPPRCDWQLETGEAERISENSCNMDYLFDELHNRLSRLEASDYMGFPTRLWSKSKDLTMTTVAFHNMLSMQTRNQHIRTIGRVGRILLMTLEALGHAGVQETLREFRVDASHDLVNSGCTPGIPIGIFDPANPFVDRLANGLKAASNLEKFHLVVGTSHGQSFRRDDNKNQECIGRVLAAMPQLEHLVLELHTLSAFHSMPTDFTFTRLRSLTLYCSKIDVELLLDFLRQHAATLETLVIEQCYIGEEPSSNRWIEVVNGITALQDEQTTHLGEIKLIKVHRNLMPHDCGRMLRWGRLGGFPVLPGFMDSEQYNWTYGDDKGLFNSRGPVSLDGSDDERPLRLPLFPDLVGGVFANMPPPRVYVARGGGGGPPTFQRHYPAGGSNN